MKLAQRQCGNCGAMEADCKSLIAMSNGVHVCNLCIGEMVALLSDDPVVVDGSAAPEGLRTPRAIVDFLNQYIIGQDDAKKSLAIAVYGHYKRMFHKGEVEISKSNVLMLGPTGTGKTLLAQTLARLLNVPFAVADATSLTQAGYVGDDVETILQRLIQAADGDIPKAERGIIFIDEIDKLAKSNSGPSITKDVSGEGVQQSLLKLIEGAKVSVQIEGNRKTPGSAKNMIDTTNILFVCAGAFVPLLEKLSKPKNVRSIGFTADTSDKAADTEVTPDMLCAHGMIPEFVGRLPVIVTLNSLTVSDLERILVEPKNAVIRQMQALFALDDAELTFEPGAITAIAEKAIKLNTGARGARAILEKILKQALFDVPGTVGASVVIGADLEVKTSYQELNKLAA